MRKIVMVALALTLVLTGCTPREDKDDKGPNAAGWDGTDYTKCQVPPAPPPGKVFGPRRGYIHILIVITADTIDGKKCRPNLEVPFNIRLYGTLDKLPAIKLDRGHTLPWVADLHTPHFEHIYVPLSSKVRIWEVIVHATITIPNQAEVIRCAIFVEETRVAQSSAHLSRNRHTATASCSVSGVTS
jgi:hypothetical protein